MQHTLPMAAHDPDARPPNAEHSRGAVQMPDSAFGDLHGARSALLKPVKRGSVA